MKTNVSGDLAREFKQANGGMKTHCLLPLSVGKGSFTYTYGQTSVATDDALSKSSTGHGNNIQCHGCVRFVLLNMPVPLTKANCPCIQKP